MSSLIISAIIAAVVAIGSGIATAVSQKKQNDRNLEQYEDWKAYNEPSAQMNRSAAAGLSPYVNASGSTLSQPFQFGQVNGMSDALANISNIALNTGSGVQNAALRKESNDINRANMEVRRDNLEWQKTFDALKRRMYDASIKAKDYQAALFWSSAEQKDVVSRYLNDTLPYRTNLSYYQALSAQQAYDFNESLNPMKLAYYAPFVDSQIANNLASAGLKRQQATHLDWSEDFQRQEAVRKSTQWFTSHNWDVRKFNEEMALKNSRLGLSSYYFALAEKKFYADILFRGLENIMNFIPRPRQPFFSRKTVAGGFPTITEGYK